MDLTNGLPGANAAVTRLYEQCFQTTKDARAAATLVFAQVLAETGLHALGATDAPVSAMSVAAVARRLGVSKETVYAMCGDGRMPCTRIGRRITISPEQLACYQTELPKTGVSLRHLS